MAGAGYKLFQTGDVLTAAQVNTYLNEQTVMVFASAAARTSALTSVLAEGMVSYLQDTNAVEVYNGSAWVGVSGAGDVTEVQAGTGISVASGTGPIPVVTNTMATAIDAEGDLIIGDAADAFQRLAIGSNTHVLTVDTSVDGKIKWAAPAGGGGMTLLSTTTLSGTSTTISISATGYNNLQILVSGMTTSNNDYPRMDLNSSSGTVYSTGTQSGNATTATELYFNAANELKKDGGLNTWLVNIANVNSTSYYKAFTSTSYGRTYLDANQARHEGGAFLSTSAITGVRIQTISGNTFSAGQVLIYGVK
jgi:hypothetical protein